MITPQRPYKTMPSTARAKLHIRHASTKTDATVTRERIARPFGAAPRSAREWN